MRKKITRRKQEMPLTTHNLISILLSGFIGFAITVILTGVISVFLKNSSVVSGTMGAYFIACVMIGALVCGFIASKKCSFKGIISGLISAIPLIFLISIMMLVFSNGRLDPKSIILFVGIVICSALGGILSANTKRRK